MATPNHVRQKKQKILPLLDLRGRQEGRSNGEKFQKVAGHPEVGFKIGGGGGGEKNNEGRVMLVRPKLILVCHSGPWQDRLFALKWEMPRRREPGGVSSAPVIIPRRRERESDYKKEGSPYCTFWSRKT